MTTTAVAEVVVGVCVVVVLLALPIVFVVLRVRWLTRMGGSFECSLLLDRSDAGAGWAFGVARYVGEDLEWFRYYAVALRPGLRVSRQEGQVIAVREPDLLEAVALYGGHRIVELQAGTEPDAPTWDLAMSAESVTGFLSWLEAAPPGQGPRSLHSPDSAW